MTVRSCWLPSVRIRALVTVLVGAAVATPVPAVTSPAQAQAEPTTTTVTWTDHNWQKPWLWVVPDGVTEVTFDVAGAGGGSSEPAAGDGGRGGRAVATIAVMPGQEITIWVGGRADHGGCGFGAFRGLRGGWNGGGYGGAVGFNSSAYEGGGYWCYAGGGGGGTDIRVGGTGLEHRVIVAGGGGGATDGNGGCGGTDWWPFGTAKGGDGGFPSGRPGGACDDGGSGGGQVYVPLGFNCSKAGKPSTIVHGQDGAPGQGGSGCWAQEVPSAGGGGGWIGGSGGWYDHYCCGYGSGGGGGSSHGPPGTVYYNGGGAGPGQPGWVIATYTVAPPTLERVEPGVGSVRGGTRVTLTGTNFVPFPGQTTVKFGSVEATEVSCESKTRCTAVTPPGVGTVPVVVTTGNGSSDGQRGFFYVAGPELDSIDPQSGSP